MATRTKEGSGHGKDKSSTSHSTSQNTDSSNAKRSHKQPSASGSPGKDSCVLSDKSVPNYLKPTISSTHEALKHLRKQNSEGSGTRRLTARKFFERHPPPSIEKHPPPSSSHAQKAPSTAAPKERTLRTSASLHAPRVAGSTTAAARTIPTKTVKTVRIGRGKSTIKEAGGVKKKETKRSQSPATSGTEGEEKEVVPDVTTEESKHEDAGEQHDQVEEVVLPVADQQHADSPLKACNSPTPAEEQEVEQATLEAEDRKIEICEDKLEHEDAKETEPVDDGDHTQQKSEGSPAVEELQVGEVGYGQQAKEVLDDDKPETETDSQVVVVAAESDKEEKEIDSAAFNEASGDKGTEEDDHVRSREAEEMEEAKVENTAAKPRKDKDVRGKREAPAAYNDVIEETASKLAAGQRKNKVKALAGAFETVISLQNTEG
ncbi:hypothetical protein ACLOJK_036843 [Asimina triloba]